MNPSLAPALCQAPFDLARAGHEQIGQLVD
jgi:hypothetical protein